MWTKIAPSPREPFNINDLTEIDGGGVRPIRTSLYKDNDTVPMPRRVDAKVKRTSTFSYPKTIQAPPPPASIPNGLKEMHKYCLDWRLGYDVRPIEKR